MNSIIKINKRIIGADHPPFVIAEIGINHGGSMKKAKLMIDEAYDAGAECVKFQVHVLEDEMVPIAKKIIPSHAKKSIWDIMKKCSFSEKEDSELKQYTEKKKMLYLCTPFSRAGADRLNKLGVKAYKIGSGECNNYPLVEHIAKFKKPIILSTGMNNIQSIGKSVNIMRKHRVPYALLHCTSMYPTPYNKVRLGSIKEFQKKFSDAIIGFSDHSIGNYASFAATALGASILEKHFTASKKWVGPDIALSIDPSELSELIFGSQAIHESLGGKKTILNEEKEIMDFAYACVVTTTTIKKGEKFTRDNLWVKRPGTGEIKAEEYEKIIGSRAKNDIASDIQLKRINII